MEWVQNSVLHVFIPEFGIMQIYSIRQEKVKSVKADDKDNQRTAIKLRRQLLAAAPLMLDGIGHWRVKEEGTNGGVKQWGREAQTAPRRCVVVASYASLLSANLFALALIHSVASRAASHPRKWMGVGPWWRAWEKSHFCWAQR